MKYVKKQTRQNYGPMWHLFLKFCKGKDIIPPRALLPFIMKYIHHIFETGIFSAMIASAIAAVSKYYIPDKDSGVNVGRYPLVTTAKKKVFW